MHCQVWKERSGAVNAQSRATRSLLMHFSNQKKIKSPTPFALDILSKVYSSHCSVSCLFLPRNFFPSKLEV